MSGQAATYLDDSEAESLRIDRDNWVEMTRVAMARAEKAEAQVAEERAACVALVQKTSVGHNGSRDQLRREIVEAINARGGK